VKLLVREENQRPTRAFERSEAAAQRQTPLAVKESLLMHEEKLRDELLAWQAGQRELHRWKLVAIGGVAALGLGLTSQQGKPQVLLPGRVEEA
jgi:hypothetical protein